MISLLRDNLQKSLGCNFDNAAANRPDLKPIAESGFHWINEELVHHLPGAILRAKGIRETKEAFKRAREGACLTRPEFEKRFAATCQFHNHSILKGYRMSDDMMGQFAPSPINLWNYGVAHRTGLPRHEDTDILRMHCLCRGDATVTEEGVMFQGKPYSNAEIESAGWLVKGRKGRFSLPILYHPLDLSTIYWIRRQGTEGRIPDLMPLQRIKVEGDFPAISLFELQKAQARQSTVNFHAAQDERAKYARHAAIRDAPAESLIPSGARGNVMTMPHPEGRHQQRIEDLGAHARTLPHLPASPPRSPGRTQSLDDIFGEDHSTTAAFTQNGGI
jgi:hypothetical protein